MSSLLSFRRKKSTDMPAIDSGAIMSYNGDVFYMAKTGGFLTFTVTSRRGAIKASFSLDDNGTRKLQQMLGVRDSSEQ